MLNEFKAWVESALGPAYLYSMGQWVETTATATARYAVIQAAGGLIQVDTRYPRFRLILLGRRNERGDAPGLMAAAESLIVAGMGDSVPCGAASVRAVGEPVGPAYTTENRAWIQVDFEVIF